VNLSQKPRGRASRREASERRGLAPEGSRGVIDRFAVFQPPLSAAAGCATVAPFLLAVESPEAVVTVSRREFLRTTGLAAGAATLAPLLDEWDSAAATFRQETSALRTYQ